MKKLFAILIMVLCVAAFSSFDAQAKRAKRSKARTTRVAKSKKGNKTCPKCKGSGEIWREMGGVGNIDGCTRCGGSGWAVTDRMGNIMENHGLRRGRGKI